MLQSLSSSSSRTSPVQTSVIQSTKTYQNGSTIETIGTTATPTTQDLKNNLSNNLINSSSTPPPGQQLTNNLIITEPNSNNLLNHQLNDDLDDGNDYINDVEMENGHATNGNGNGYKNGNNDTICDSIDTDEEMGEFCFLFLYFLRSRGKKNRLF